MQRSGFLQVLDVPLDLTVVESRVRRRATVPEFQGHSVNVVLRAPVSFSERRGSHQEQYELRYRSQDVRSQTLLLSQCISL
jgi:hypothetical protein